MSVLARFIPWLSEWAVEVNAIVSIFLTAAILWVYLKQRDIMESQTEIEGDQTSIQSTQTDLMKSQIELMESQHKAAEKPLVEALDLTAHPQNRVTFTGSNFGNGAATNMRLRSTLTVPDERIDTFPATAEIKYEDSREIYSASLYPGDLDRELVSHVVCGYENPRTNDRGSTGFRAVVSAISNILGQEEIEISLKIEVVYEDILENTFTETIVDTGRAFATPESTLMDVL